MKQAFHNLKHFFRLMGVRWHYFVVQTLSFVVIPFLDGMSLLLLVPLIDGFIRGDFIFIQNLPVFGSIIALFPGLIAQNANLKLFALIMGSIVLAATLKNLCAYGFALYSEYWHGRFAGQMKQVIFGRYLSFGKMYFDRTSQGTITGMLGFADQIVELLRTSAAILTTFFSIIVYLIILSCISWKLTLFVLVVFPAYYYSVQWVIKLIHTTAQQRTVLSLDLNRELFNILSSIGLIKAYNREEEAQSRFAKMNDDLRSYTYQIAKKEQLIQPLQETLTIIALFLLVIAMVLMAARGEALSVASCLLFLYLSRICVPMFARLNHLRVPLIQARVPLENLMTIFQDNDKYLIPSGTRRFRGLVAKIDFRNLSFGYTTVPILRDANFSIERGKRTAIVGPSGAGKTTIINLIMRFYDCPTNSIFVDGVDIREFTLESLKDKIALVSQDIFIFNDTLRNNLQFGQNHPISDQALFSVLRRARLDRFVEALPNGLDTEVGDRGVQLSGGEKQRLAIARALLKDAEILILDEVTSSLDSGTEKALQGAIEALTRDKTVIVVAHRLSTIKHADKIIVLEQGRVVEEGSLLELLARRRTFFRYWQDQKLWVDDGPIGKPQAGLEINPSLS